MNAEAALSGGPQVSSAGAPEQSSKRRKRTRGNSIYLNRPEFRSQRATVRERGGNAWRQTWSIYVDLCVLCADDPTGEVRWGDNAICRELGVSPPAWREHRTTLMLCGLLERNLDEGGQQVSLRNQDDDRIPYRLPRFAE